MEPLQPALILEGGVPSAGDDDVVEHGDVEQGARLAEHAGEIPVVPARRGIARGMVVDEDDRGGPLAHGVVEGVGRPDVSPEEPARGDVAVADEDVLGVQHKKPEHFVGQSRHLLAVDGDDVPGVEDGPVCALGVADAVAERKGCSDDRRLGEPEALDLHELVYRGFREGPKAAEFVDEGSGQRHGVVGAVACAKQDGEQLSVGAGGLTELSEPLPRLLVGGPFGDALARLGRHVLFRRLNQNLACSRRYLRPSRSARTSSSSFRLSGRIVP